MYLFSLILHISFEILTCNCNCKVNSMGSDAVVDNKNWIEREEVPLEQLVNDFSKFVEAIRCRYVDKDYFTRLKSDEERVRYCLEKKEVQDGFDLFINACSSVAEVKSDEKAKSYRLEGNKFFKLKNNEEALKYYSMVIKFICFDISMSISYCHFFLLKHFLGSSVCFF